MITVDPRASVLELVRRFGWNATSFQILEPGLCYWFCGALGCVAYVDTGRAWVAAGAPLAAAADLGHVAEGFVRAARAQRRRAVFFATEARFVESSRYTSWLIGEQPVWDPRAWRAQLGDHSSLREQLRRARAKDVVVSPVSAADVAVGTPLRLAIEALIAKWLRAKSLPPMGFLVRVDPFGFVEERRLFVARGPGQQLLGLAGMVPIYARQGWLVEDLVRSPRAPNGTVELLVDAAMRDAADLGSRYVTLGLSPLMGAVAPSLHWASKYGSALYDFHGLRAFKAKFRPSEWSPIYISHPDGEPAFLALHACLKAFAPRGLVRFGLEALLRSPNLWLRTFTRGLGTPPQRALPD